MHEVSSVRTHV